MCENDIDALIAKYIDGEITQEELLTLNKELKTDPALRMRFAENAIVDRVLKQSIAKPISVDAVIDLLPLNKTADRVLETLESSNIKKNSIKNKRKRDSRNSHNKRKNFTYVKGKNRRTQAKSRARTSPLKGFILSLAALFAIVAGIRLYNQHILNATREKVGLQVVRFSGTVQIIDPDGLRILRSNMIIPLDCRIKTLSDSEVTMRYFDNTSISLSANTQIRINKREATSKTIHLIQGTLQANVAPQPKGYPLRLYSPDASGTVVGTVLKYSYINNRTRLDVEKGKVKFQRLKDNKTLFVKAGFYAETETLSLEPLPTGAEPKAGKAVFELGVNFNGDSVVVNGHRWMGQKEAMNKGLRISSEDIIKKVSFVKHDGKLLFTNAPKSLRNILQTNIFVNSGEMTIAYPLPDGKYQVSLYVGENCASYIRKINLRLENKLVAENLGFLPFNEWKIYGPYQVTVVDKEITIGIVKVSADPHIMGILIERLVSTP